jgi:hypothetical protein
VRALRLKPSLTNNSLREMILLSERIISRKHFDLRPTC